MITASLEVQVTGNVPSESVTLAFQLQRWSVAIMPLHRPSSYLQVCIPKPLGTIRDYGRSGFDGPRRPIYVFGAADAQPAFSFVFVLVVAPASGPVRVILATS